MHTCMFMCACGGTDRRCGGSWGSRGEQTVTVAAFTSFQAQSPPALCGVYFGLLPRRSTSALIIYSRTRPAVIFAKTSCCSICANWPVYMIENLCFISKQLQAAECGEVIIWLEGCCVENQGQKRSNTSFLPQHLLLSCPWTGHGIPDCFSVAVKCLVYCPSVLDNNKTLFISHISHRESSWRFFTSCTTSTRHRGIRTSQRDDRQKENIKEMSDERNKISQEQPISMM